MLSLNLIGRSPDLLAHTLVHTYVCMCVYVSVCVTCVGVSRAGHRRVTVCSCDHCVTLSCGQLVSVRLLEVVWQLPLCIPPPNCAQHPYTHVSVHQQKRLLVQLLLILLFIISPSHIHVALYLIFTFTVLYTVQRHAAFIKLSIISGLQLLCKLGDFSCGYLFTFFVSLFLH